jgi:hypothetical protein
MDISIHVIRDPSRLDEIEDSWNGFVRLSSNSPFHSLGFVRHFMVIDRNLGWRPVVLVAYSDDKIIGIAPMKEMRRFGVRWVKFACWPQFSPDFITDCKAREHIIGKMLECLFGKLGCHLADLCVSSDSVTYLEKICRLYGLQLSLSTPPIFGHRILPVSCDWNDFERFRGSNFRNKMRKIGRKFSQIGAVEITCVQNPRDDATVLERILGIERLSWKETYRKQKQQVIDTSIPMLCSASLATAKSEPDFEWRVYFLELNKMAIAYSLVLKYKDTAYIAKITYDEGYRRYYPGIYLINGILKEEFTLRRVRNIDFQTDMQFMETWTKKRLLRFRALVSRGVLPFVIHAFVMNYSLVRVRYLTLGYISKKLPALDKVLAAFSR